MVTGRKQHSEKTPANQGPQEILAVTETLWERIWAEAAATTPRTKARSVTLPMPAFLSGKRKDIRSELRGGALRETARESGFRGLVPQLESNGLTQPPAGSVE